ncbi:MAG: hypothetical protein WBA16_05335 [Nonlabens sp.]
MNKWFEQQDFDLDSLPSGHRSRFINRLDALCKEEVVTTGTTKPVKGRVVRLSNWYVYALVATIALLLGISGMQYKATMNQGADLASISPEMARAQDFFTTTIDQELSKLNEKSSPETERIIADAKSSLRKLEQEYLNIQKDLNINKDSKAVIAAMIENFQHRIAILETALEQIEQQQLQLIQSQDEELI